MFFALMFYSSFLLLLLSSQTQYCPGVCDVSFSLLFHYPNKECVAEHSDIYSFCEPFIYQTHSVHHLLPSLIHLSSLAFLLSSMFKPVQTDNRSLRLDLRPQIQRGIELAT